EEPPKARSRYTSKWTREVIEQTDAGRDVEYNYREESRRPRAYSERQKKSTRAPSRSPSYRRTTPRRSSSQKPPHRSTRGCLPGFPNMAFGHRWGIHYLVYFSHQHSNCTANFAQFFGFGNTRLSESSIERLIPNIVHILSEDHGNIIEAIKLHDEFPTNDISHFPGKSRDSMQEKIAIIKQHRDIKRALGRINNDRDQILHTISRESTSLIHSFELQKKHEIKVIDTVNRWPSHIATLGQRLSVLTAWCEELHLKTEQLLWTRDRQARADARILQTDRTTLARIQKVLSLVKSTEASALKAYNMAKAVGAKMEEQPRSKRVGFLGSVPVPPFDDDVYKGLVEGEKLCCRSPKSWEEATLIVKLGWDSHPRSHILSHDVRGWTSLRGRRFLRPQTLSLRQRCTRLSKLRGFSSPAQVDPPRKKAQSTSRVRSISKRRAVKKFRKPTSLWWTLQWNLVKLLLLLKLLLIFGNA
ncbi:unnamed protein product, partial [Aureobasidium pullulans]